MGDVSGRVVAFEQPIAQRSGTSDFNIEYSVQDGIRRFDVYLPNFNVEGIQATSLLTLRFRSLIFILHLMP
jgi:hypothetical protein